MNDFCKIGIFTGCTNERLIKPVEFLSLKPGDKVNRIGRYNKNNEITSSCRVDIFSLLLTYKGIVEYDSHEWICFEVPSEGIGGFDLFHPEQPISIMYQILRSPSKSQDEDYIELIVPYMSSHGGSIRIYKPCFSNNG